MEANNMKAMRDALEALSAWAKVVKNNPKDTTAIECAEFVEETIKTALAAHRKNCERFQTWGEAKDAYWREQGDPCDWRKLGAWLFAPERGAK